MNSTGLLARVEVAPDWRETFGADQYRQGRVESTVAAYQLDVMAFAGWFLLTNGEEFRPELLTNYDLRAFRTWSLEVARVSTATWNRRRAALRVFSAWCRAQGYISYDVMDGVLGVAAEEEAPRWLEKNEYARLMRQVEINHNAANTPERVLRAKRDAALVAVMVFAALRESEAAALLRSDIKLSERAGKLLVRLGKGDKSRPVPLNGEARRWLGEWLGVCPTERVFDLTTRAIQKRIALLGAQASVADLTPHRLRHTCIKRMVDGGAQLTAAQKIAGHAKIETTARYAAAGWADLEEAVEGVILGKSKRGA